MSEELMSTMSTTKKTRNRREVLKRGQSRSCKSGTICIKNAKEVKKVKRSNAESFLSKGYTYASHTEWRAYRGKEVVKEVPVETVATTEVTEFVVDNTPDKKMKAKDRRKKDSKK